MWGILRILAIVYVGILVLVFLGQRQLQYHPGSAIKGGPADHAVPEMRVMSVTTEDGLKLTGWYAPPKDGRLVVVLFHGNAGDVSDRAHKARALIDAGYGVLLAEYRGYGGNPGSPDEMGFYRDARAFLRWVAAEGGVPLPQTVLYGESIGSGVAVQMAVEHKEAAGLMLEAPFTSALDVAQGIYWWLPVRWLMLDRFMSAPKMQYIEMPLLIVHGDADRVVPFELGRKLFEASGEPKTFVAVAGGGHSNLYDFGMAGIVTAFLARISGPAATAPPVSP